MYEHKSNRFTHYILIYTRAYWHFRRSTIAHWFCDLEVNTVFGWLWLDESVAQLWWMTTYSIQGIQTTIQPSANKHTPTYLRTFTQTEVIARFSWIQWMNACVGYCCVVRVSVAPWYVISVPLQMLWMPTPSLNAVSLTHYIIKVAFPWDLSFVSSEDCVLFSFETCI